MKFHRGKRSAEHSIHSPQDDFLMFIKESLEDITFQTFFIPHIVGLAAIRNKSMFEASLAPIDIRDGILQAKENGIFRREITSRFGRRRTVCPFGIFGTGWLVQNLGGTEDPADTSLVCCYKKVLTERDNNPQVKALCSAVREGLAKIMAEYRGLPEEVEVSTIRPHTPAGAASRREDSVQCPFHQFPG